MAALYGDAYAYYQEPALDAPREGRSLKYTLAGRRYGHLVRDGLRARLAALLAGVAEVAAWKTVSFSLGIPLAMASETRMLDYGCGAGWWLLAMRSRGFSRLEGFDIGANRGLRERLEGSGIQVHDRSSLDARRDGAFELIRFEHVFEHLPDPKRVLRLAARLLGPAGWLVMTFPSMQPWLRQPDLATSPLRDHLQLPMHLAYHSRESAMRIVGEAGFDVIGCRLTRRENFLTLAARRR